MIVSINVSHFVKICQVLTILHQLICRGVAIFGTWCINQHDLLSPSIRLHQSYDIYLEDKMKTTAAVLCCVVYKSCAQ